MEDDFNVAGLADERLWLLRLAAERTRLPSIRHICFRIPVNDLKCVINYLGFFATAAETATLSLPFLLSSPLKGEDLLEGNNIHHTSTRLRWQRMCQMRISGKRRKRFAKGSAEG